MMMMAFYIAVETKMFISVNCCHLRDTKFGHCIKITIHGIIAGTRKILTKFFPKIGNRGILGSFLKNIQQFFASCFVCLKPFSFRICIVSFTIHTFSVLYLARLLRVFLDIQVLPLS